MCACSFRYACFAVTLSADGFHASVVDGRLHRRLPYGVFKQAVLKGTDASTVACFWQASVGERMGAEAMLLDLQAGCSVGESGDF